MTTHTDVEKKVEEFRRNYRIKKSDGGYEVKYNDFQKGLLDSWLRQALTEMKEAGARETYHKLADWIENHKGVSSTAIYVYMSTGKLPKPFACPHDESDRKRCKVLLEAVPEWIPRLEEIEDAEIKGTRNGIECYPWREQMPLIKQTLNPTNK